MPTNDEHAPKVDVQVKDEAGKSELSLSERIAAIPCLCPQCGGGKWKGKDSAFLALVDRGSDELLKADEAEWESYAEHLRETRKPVWTAEELASSEDRSDRAQIAAAEDIDIYCARTRYVVHDLAGEGFWGPVAVDRLSPAPVLEKPLKSRQRRKQTKPVALFDLFGDFGVVVPIYEQTKRSKMINTSATKGEK